jgi:MFS family permease
MYSICTNFFPEDKDAMVGYIEAVTGVGLILGPLIGSGLYAIGGYNFIFFSFGGLFIFLNFWIPCIFPSRVDGDPEDDTYKAPTTTDSKVNEDDDAY